MSGSTTAQTVQSYYQTILQRTGGVSEISYWTTLVSNGGLTLGQVENDIVGSAEAQTFVAPVVEAYEVSLGRVPDAAGLTAWVHLAESGTSIAAIEADIANSPESIALYGTTVSATSLTKLYQNAFNRAPDAAGLTAWLNSGLSMAQIEVGFLNSAEGQSDLGKASTNYLLTIGNGGTVTGNLYTSGGGIPGSTFTLTTGVDNITGTPNNDTFIATLGGLSPTLNPGDTINGNGGSDTLKIIDSVGGAANLAAVNITNVQTLAVQNISGAPGVYDFSLLQGMSKAIALNTTGVGSDNFTNLATGAQVVASGAGSGIGSTALFSMKTATDAVTAGVDSGATGVNLVDTNGTETAATINSTGSANGTTANPDNFVLTNGGATLKTLTVNAAANLVATLAAADFAATGAALTVTGTGTANLSSVGALNFKTVDATNSGGLTLVETAGGNLTSFTGGAGNDSLTLGAVTPAAFTFNGGGGNNTLNVAATEMHTITAGSQLNGGSGGTNTLVINDAAPTAADYTALNAVTNFQVLGLGVAATVDASKITTGFGGQHFALMNAGANTITGLATGTTTVDISKATTGDTFSVATGTNTLNLNIGTSSTTGLLLGAETTTGFGTINVASNGKAATPPTANTVAFNNSDNTTFNITGSENLNMTVAPGTTTGDIINAGTFAGALNLTASNFGDVITAGNGNNTINAGGGNDTVTVGSGTNSITGGPGADTITINHASLTNVDTLHFGLADSPLTGLDTVSGFVGGQSGDVLDATGVGSANLFTALTANQLTAVAGAANLTAAAGLAATDANAIGWTTFTFGTSTYAENNVTKGAYTAGTDNVVNLGTTALASLTQSNFA